VRIENTPRAYAWGSHTAIAGLLGTAPSGAPEAELWLGDHPASPARIVAGSDDAGGASDLHALLRARGQRLPFLLKVLAAGEPLSLQVHPTIAQARAGFARENAAGIALDDPTRMYTDELHKPELIYALSDPFIALSGFRPTVETRAELATVGEHCVDELVERLTGDDVLADTVAWLLAGGSEVAQLADVLAEEAGEDHPHDPHGTWATVRRLAARYPGDPGVVVSTLMNTVVLRPGEALYLPAGNLHAYQQGLGIEVMAASDNVLRGGLTSKHVDVPELMRVLDARPLLEPRIAPREVAPGVRRFEPSVVDFALTVIEPEGARGGAVIDAPAGAVVLCLAGSVTVDGALVLERGQAAFTDEPVVGIHGDGRVVVATGEHPAAPVTS
jgi:mannose-6-phosphate isomerase